MKSRNITLGRITFSEELDDSEKGEVFSVTVSVDGEQKSITNLGPFNGLDIAATATQHEE
ncbi:MAG: hypothetical protein VXZ82_11825 [Planctomycetota bacterium]|nr:hypothetical protein [Planctomycetota bacterium]